MTAGEQIALEPALAHVFAQDFHHAAGARQIFIDRKRFSFQVLPVPVITSCKRFDAVSSGPKTRKFFDSKFASITAWRLAQHACGLGDCCSGSIDLYGKVAEARHGKRLRSKPPLAWGFIPMRNRPFWCDVGEFVSEASHPKSSSAGLVAAHPTSRRRS